MRKVLTVLKMLIMFPVRIFSKISPFAIIHNSKTSKNSSILSGTRFYNSSIDDYSFLGRSCLVCNTKIGKFCSIADNCYIGLASHPIDWVSTSPVFHSGKNILRKNFSQHSFNSTPETSIGNDVWIGISVCVLPGLKIGDGAIIGAGSVVTKDVEPYSIVAGNPARVLRKRFDTDTVQKLIASQWWNLSEEEIVDASDNFNNVSLFLEVDNK